MTSRNGHDISWTSYNQPSVINGAGQSVAFDYDENHQRWRAVYTGPAGTETTYLIGGLLEQVVDVGDTDFRHYVYAGAEKVAIVSRTTSGVNTVRYLRTDHLGGVDGIENPDGTSYVKESFAAFGHRRSSCTWTGSPTTGQLSRMAAATRRGFTFHTALGTMGLNDMNGRVEDAVIGRCLSADPHVPDFTNTQDFNRYSYVRNDPLTYIDPSGFDCADTSTGPCQTVTITGTKGSSQQQGAPPPGFLPGGFVSPNGSGQPIPANVFGQGELQTVVVTDTRVTHPTSTPVAVSFVPIGTGDLGSFGAPQFAIGVPQMPPPNQPEPPCPNGSSPSRTGGPRTGYNMLLGLKIGGTAGALIGGGFVAAQILGFPEAEVSEGAGALAVAGYRTWQFLSTIGAEHANTIANGALLGGSLFGGLGMVTGLASTTPTCGAGGRP